METNSNNNNNRKEGKLETWVWLVSQHPMAAAAQRSRVESLSVWTWMSDCTAIGFPLSFCTGTEEIAGWEKVTWPNESSHPPRKCLNTISLLSHCSSLLCLSNTMFVCCLHAPVQSSDCSEDCSCPSVCISRKMSLFSPIPLLTFIFFVSWSVYPIFNPLPRIFWDIIKSLDGKSFSLNNILRCAGKRIPLGSFKGNCIPTVSIAGVPRDGIYTQLFAR